MYLPTPQELYKPIVMEWIDPPVKYYSTENDPFDYTNMSAMVGIQDKTENVFFNDPALVRNDGLKR